MGRRRGIAALAAAVLAAALAASPAGAEEVTIYRDAFGIPHVESPSPIGAAYGTGYALAYDRPFLTIGIRLQAQGRIAELLGDPGLVSDVPMRRDFYDAADVQRQYEALPVEIKRQLQAFADGFNRGFGEVMADPGRRPAIFDLLGYTPEPWKPTDSVSVAMLFTYAVFAGEGGAGQLANAELLARLQQRLGSRAGLRAWDDVLFKNDPAAPTVVQKGDETPEPRSITRAAPGRAQRKLAVDLAGALGRAADERRAEARSIQALLPKLPWPKIGSYGVALGPKLTKSGGAMVLGSPQSGISAPPVFWQFGSHVPGRDCTGFTVPGLGPWTGIGWCNEHAWTLVAGNMGEQVDNYVEHLDPSTPRRYRFQGEWRDMDVRREVFHVGKCVPPLCTGVGGPHDEVVEIESTVHGPVVARPPSGGIAITQRRMQRGIWAQALAGLDGWNSATSLREFNAAADQAPATYNMVYGDAAGHIMYRFTGRQPVRPRGSDRRLPEDGDGSMEWTGALRPRDMPHVVDPPSGLIVANQGIESKPNRWWPNSSSVAVGQASRVGGNRRILLAGAPYDTARLEGTNPLLLERRDVITPRFERLLRRALSGSSYPRLKAALAQLDAWAKAGYPRVDSDGDGNYDFPGFTIFGADDFSMPSDHYPRYLWSDLLRRVFEDELGRTPGGSGDRGTFQAPGTWLGQISTLKLALDGRGASRRMSRDFVDDVTTKRRERAVSAIRASVRVALDRLTAEFKTDDMSRWLRPVVMTPFDALGVVAPPPIRAWDHGTYSQIVDPKAGAGEFIVAPGNQAADSSGDILSSELGRFPKHFDDQRAIYERYGYIPMRHAADQYRAAPESVVRLSYSLP
jgi:penicillin amidase